MYDYKTELSGIGSRFFVNIFSDNIICIYYALCNLHGIEATACAFVKNFFCFALLCFGRSALECGKSLGQRHTDFQ